MADLDFLKFSMVPVHGVCMSQSSVSGQFNEVIQCQALTTGQLDIFTGQHNLMGKLKFYCLPHDDGLLFDQWSWTSRMNGVTAV